MGCTYQIPVLIYFNKHKTSIHLQLFSDADGQVN